MNDVIGYYHDLLSPDIALESWEQLQQSLAERRLVFGSRPVCSVLRPYFLSPGESATIQTAAGHLVSALHKTFATVPMSGYESVLGLTPVEAELASIESGFSPNETLARLDAFWLRKGSLGFVEYNSESPGGIAFGQTLATIFQDLPVMRMFRSRYRIQSEPSLDHSLDALVSVFRRWSGGTSAPAVAIVDWASAPTYIEFELCRERLEQRGIKAKVLDPSELEYSGGKLRSGDFEIDLVYRRIVASDVASRLGTDHPLVRAARDRAACIASGFRAFAMMSKAMFALVSDPTTSPDLTTEERATVNAHVPWTRFVADGRTHDWNGREVDLVEFVATHQSRLVLKPLTDYGGSGVHLGWTQSPEEWHGALRRAIDSPSIVQQRIGLPQEPFPTVTDGEVEFIDYLADIDPYVFDGRTNMGAGTRLSRSQLLNVSAGGGSAAPVFVVEPIE